MEFALDNVQKLKLRTEKLQAQQHALHNDTEDLQQNDHLSTVGSIANMKLRNRKSRDGHASLKTFGNKKRELKNELIEGTTIEEGSKKQKGSQRGMRNSISSSEKKLNKSKARVNKEESIEAGLKRKRWILHDQFEQSKEGNGPRNRKRRKKNDPVGRDVVDKLDVLIEQYRSKFTGSDSIQTDDKKQGSKHLKRWFES